MTAENVDGLVSGRFAGVFSEILGALSGLGFVVEWDVVSACAVGAPHARRRLFLVAYPDREHGSQRLGTGQQSAADAAGNGSASAWRDSVDRAVATSGAHDREADGFAGRMVAAGGNAVVPQVAEAVGRLIIAHVGAVAS